MSETTRAVSPKKKKKKQRREKRMGEKQNARR